MSFIQEYLPFYKRNLKVAVPVMFAQLGQATVQLADTIMVGRLGTNELAAVSFASAIFFIGFVIVIGASMGSTPIIGQTYVQKKYREVGAIFQNSILFDFLLVFVVCLVMYAFSFFMDRMGQPDEVITLAVPYYRILLLSLPPFILFQAFRQFMEGIGDTKIAMYITIFANVANIGLNYVLIFGKFGFPEMGMIGASIATVISRVMMPVCYLIIFKWKSSLWRYFRFFSREVFSVQKQKLLASMGLPIGFQMLVETVTFSLCTIMVGWFGAVSLAGHQIAGTVSSTTFMVVVGISSATTIRVSHQFGVKDYPSLRKAGFASLHLVVAYSLMMALLLVLFRNQIPLLFSNDPYVIKMTSTLLIMAAIFQLADGLQVVGLGALRGMADVKHPMLFAVICYTLINLPVGYICGVVLDMGVVGVWIGYIFGLYVAAFLLVRRFLRISNRLIK
ncbi:MAG: MATE family efflux transporter [Prevotellaceae bacterium]|jgi:MATE family multidrug resistance protein|nr:MATE family efflux transporter [Prevotellaceae bacterium]